MKVCHLSSAHPPFDNRIFYKECMSLSKAGHDVFYVVPGHVDEKINGVQIIGVKKNTNRLKRMIFTVSSVYKKAMYINADVFHFHDPELIWVGWLLKRKNKKVIYDVHEDVPRQILAKYWLPIPLRRITSIIVEKIERYFSKDFDAIVTATPFIKNRFLKYNPKTIDINNYPQIENIQIDWTNKKNEICYIGSIAEIRGVKELIAAIESIDVKLHLAGIFSPLSLRKELVSKKGWKKIIEWGFVDRKTISKILSRSKIGMVTLYPAENYLDSQPTKMYEYMAAGIPVIASDFPYWKKIVETNNCGICVNPFSSKQISDAILFYLKSEDSAKKHGLNGREAILNTYNWANEEKKLIELYDSLN